MREFRVKTKQPTVFYLSPDYNKPSWGIATLYNHVRLLRRNNIEAAIVHQNAPFRLNWMESIVPVTYLDDASFTPQPVDVLVVPEVLAGDEYLRRIDCHRIAFVQGSFLMLSHLTKAVTYSELGYERVITIMPHIKKIIERHYGMQATVIPNFIASYFFLDREALKSKSRARQIVLFPKPEYRKVGYNDYDILKKLLDRRISRKKLTGSFGQEHDLEWKLIELKDKKHKEVARIMKESVFFVNVNCLESFNATVPEAMAAGCVTLCYEAYGGSDFLENEKNAYVFPNNYVYPLLDKLFELMANYDLVQEELLQIRINSHTTARQYTKENTERALMDFYRSIL